ncbi:BRCT domain-containing protein [Pseudarthrobacter sp. NPDC058119]|uniref:BRCT domain-containing protein n=1 Tax=Pseudarthrobacter sp. NPDC058119 TaxID=3346348 RepID=UPI0036D81456
MYLFHFPDWHAYKVGITNSGNDSRLDRHRLAGGRLLELIEVPHRGAAFWVEQEVLNAMMPWPATGLPTDRVISGWTEMWDDSAPINVRLGDYIEAASAITLDRELIEDWKRNRSVPVLPSSDFTLNRGDTVCFTGSGPEKSRAQWKTLAQGVGLRVAGSVTSITSVLVAPPGGSPNAKVVAALSTGVPVISYEVFLAAVEGLK